MGIRPEIIAGYLKLVNVSVFVEARTFIDEFRQSMFFSKMSTDEIELALELSRRFVMAELALEVAREELTEI